MPFLHMWSLVQARRYTLEIPILDRLDSNPPSFAWSCCAFTAMAIRTTTYLHAVIRFGCHSQGHRLHSSDSKRNATGPPPFRPRITIIICLGAINSNLLALVSASHRFSLVKRVKWRRCDGLWRHHALFSKWRGYPWATCSQFDAAPYFKVDSWFLVGPQLENCIPMKASYCSCFGILFSVTADTRTETNWLRAMAYSFLDDKLMGMRWRRLW